jgi:exosome complex exonuclease DIS3/RRP44
MGFNLDFSSNKNLADSLDSIKRNNDSFFNKLVRIMTTRAMNEAVYFCTADADYPEFYHYGLAAPLYTHFTSPIRRYADVLVHRLLAAALDLDSIPGFMSNKLKMTKICEKMNMRNRNARFASRASSDFNTYLFFKVYFFYILNKKKINNIYKKKRINN